jgi:2-haloacid dehalogenase
LTSGVTSPSVVLFDLGGVLLPFDPGLRVRAVARALAIEEAAAAAALSPAMFAALDLGEASLADFADAFARAGRRAVDEAEAQALILSVFEPPRAALWALAGQLRGKVTVGGFSDNPPFVATMFPVGAWLEPMFWSAELGVTKSSDAAFAKVERRLGVEPEAILLIDDAAGNIERARRRGWQAAQFTTMSELTVALAERGLA